MNAFVRNFAKNHWPLCSVMGVYYVTVMVLLLLSARMNQGHLIYPLDDTYIHMAIAKNAVLHHVWGVTKYEFTSTTSSPLYTFLLAITYLAFGVNEWMPLILNLVFGTSTILFSYFLLTRYVESHLWKFLVLLIAVFVAPLPSLTISGMEHVLHALLSLCFVYCSMQALAAQALSTKKAGQYDWLLIFLAPLVTTIRYEGIFLAFIVCVLFLLQRRISHALILGIAALLPLILYGICSINHGWYFLPNSILLKGQMPGFSLEGIIEFVGYHALSKTHANGHILLLLLAALALLVFRYLKKDNLCDKRKYANLIFVGSVLFHMQFASTGWFYRYEAYLVLLGFIVISLSISDFLPNQWVSKFDKELLPQYVARAFLVLILSFPYCNRALDPLLITPQATNNIYDQQYHMAIFLKEFYQGRTIALNDIGAVTYLADIRLLDVYGLGSIEPASLKLQKRYTSQKISDLSQDQKATIAVVYDERFERFGGKPPKWERTGQWKISNNVVCSSDTVSLYAIAPTATKELMRNLRQFTTRLPSDVKQFGKYTSR